MEVVYNVFVLDSDEFGIATGAEREELKWKQQVELFPTHGLELEVLVPQLDLY